MSNNWNQPPTGSQPTGSQPDGNDKNRAPRTGNLLSNYQQANEGAKQFSPISMPSRGPSPSSPLPPGQVPGMPPPVPGQMSPRSGLLSSARQSGQGALNNAVQMVRGMSGKMAAIGRPPMSPPLDFRQSAPSPDSRQMSPSPDSRQAGTFGNAIQMVRSVSGKMAAISRQNIAPPPAPLVRYHPPVVSMPESTMPAAKRWKRSSAVRLATRIRHRRARMQGGGKRIAIGVLIALLALLVIGSSSGTAYGYTYYQDQQPQLQSIANQQISQITHIYDRNGVLLADATDNSGNGRRIYVSYDQIPPVMDIAQMAAEDPTFMTNGGIDPQGLLRAVVYLGKDGGGSTITQQLIKMMRDDGKDTSVTRKLSEGALAIGLTQQYSKEKILEMYLNIAPYGILKLGVEDAAQEYFGLTRNCDKNFKCTSAISQLDYNTVTKKHDPLLALARASLLASIPQNPSQYDLTLWETSSVFKNAVLGRQKDVLNRMMTMMALPIQGIGPNGQAGLITTAIMQQVETMSAAMTFTDHRPGVKAPHFVNWVVSQLAGILGNGDANLGAQMLENGGYNIRTTIDANLETYVENSVKRHLTQSEYQPFPYGHYAILNQDNNVNDAAVVVMNAKNGEVLAMNGSLDYNSTKQAAGGQVNAAALSNAGARQPGSTFKPIVYATTFEMGWSPGTVLPDYKTYFANGDNAGASVTAAGVYTPPDYGGTYHNLSVMPIRLATANSLNVPAVKAIAFAGLDNVIATAERMGMTAIADKANQCKADGKNYTSCFGVSLVLGTTGVPLIQMVDAYQTFADQGVHVPPQSILDIWDNYGHNLYHFDPAHPQTARVLSAQVAYMMTSILTDEASRAMEFQGDHDLSFYDWPGNECYSRKPLPDCLEHQVAAKTGTTDGFIDNWAIGYTPDVVVGVWAGNADGSDPMTGNVVGITGAGPIWHGVMELVSGLPCVDGKDQYGVSCSNFNQKALGFNDATFTQPAGIHQACLSSVNGLLAGTGTGCAYDWVLDGQDPIQTGILQAPTSTTTGKNGNNGNNGN